MVAASEQPVLPGSPVTLGRASATEMVHDFQVEIAQTSSVADPEMRPSFRGMQAGLVVLPVADRGWWVELAFASATHDPSDAEIDMGSESLAGKRRDALLGEFSVTRAARYEALDRREMIPDAIKAPVVLEFLARRRAVGARDREVHVAALEEWRSRATRDEGLELGRASRAKHRDEVRIELERSRLVEVVVDESASAPRGGRGRGVA